MRYADLRNITWYDGPVIEVDIAGVFRAEHGRAVAVLTRVFGDLEIAEDAVQDAFAAAVEKWPESGVPPSPAGWIVTTARNRAIDRLRRESAREDKHAQAVLLQAQDEPVEEGAVQDDRLRLIFTCCHPALALNVRVALTLRMLGGLTTAEIGRAFLVPEPTMAQRLVRAKAKIRAAGIPYRVPYEAKTPDGALVLLADQDRSLWDRALIGEGQQLVRRCLRRNQPGPYQLQAAINAVHSDAATAADTDWRQILQLYDHLLTITPTPIVGLNRAVAVAEVDGPSAALELVDDLDLGSYYLFHAIRADLLVRVGRMDEARAAYSAAIDLTTNQAEQDFLHTRLDGI